MEPEAGAEHEARREGETAELDETTTSQFVRIWQARGAVHTLSILSARESFCRALCPGELSTGWIEELVDDDGSKLCDVHGKELPRNGQLKVVWS